MPIVTTLGQRCTVYLDAGGVQRFKIESSIDAVLAGDLPVFGLSPFTSFVFVHKIGVPDDPKSDTFLRVGNIADLTTLALGREAALLAFQTLYLAIEFTVVYDDIATASSAKVLIQQRVDNLIADWHKYNEQFLAPLTSPPNTSDIPLPLTNGIISERTAAYNTAHAEYLAAKSANAVATANVTSTAAAAAAANAASAQAISDSLDCSTVQGEFATGKGAVDVYRNSVNNFVNAASVFDTAAALYGTYVTPTSGQRTIFNAAESAFATARFIMAAEVTLEATNGAPMLTKTETDINAQCAVKVTAVGTTATAKTSADNAAALAQTEKKAADAAESAALVANAQAFLQLKVVCPTAEPTVP